MGIISGQAVGGMDVEAVETARRRVVAEPLQTRTDQGAAAVAVVEIGGFVIDVEAVGLDPGLDFLDLAGDGVVLGLLVGGDACVESDTRKGRRHGSSPLSHGLDRTPLRDSDVFASWIRLVEPSPDDGQDGLESGGKESLLIARGLKGAVECGEVCQGPWDSRHGQTLPEKEHQEPSHRGGPGEQRVALAIKVSGIRENCAILSSLSSLRAPRQLGSCLGHREPSMFDSLGV